MRGGDVNLIVPEDYLVETQFIESNKEGLGVGLEMT